jgi:hypothetical protein
MKLPNKSFKLLLKYSSKYVFTLKYIIFFATTLSFLIALAGICYSAGMTHYWVGVQSGSPQVYGKDFSYIEGSYTVSGNSVILDGAGKIYYSFRSERDIGWDGHPYNGTNTKALGIYVNGEDDASFGNGADIYLTVPMFYWLYCDLGANDDLFVANFDGTNQDYGREFTVINNSDCSGTPQIINTCDSFTCKAAWSDGATMLVVKIIADSSDKTIVDSLRLYHVTDPEPVSSTTTYRSSSTTTYRSSSTTTTPSPLSSTTTYRSSSTTTIAPVSSTTTYRSSSTTTQIQPSSSTTTIAPVSSTTTYRSSSTTTSPNGSTTTYRSSTTTYRSSSTSTVPCSTPAPGIPSNPTPPDRATNVFRGTDYSWSSTSNTDFYAVYFGTSPDPPLVDYFDGNYLYFYDLPFVLGFEITYYWKIVAYNNNNCNRYTPGPVWSFTTGPAAYYSSSTTTYRSSSTTTYRSSSTTTIAPVSSTTTYRSSSTTTIAPVSSTTTYRSSSTTTTLNGSTTTYRSSSSTTNPSSSTTTIAPVSSTTTYRSSSTTTTLNGSTTTYRSSSSTTNPSSSTTTIAPVSSTTTYHLDSTTTYPYDSTTTIAASYSTTTYEPISTTTVCEDCDPEIGITVGTKIDLIGEGYGFKKPKVYIMYESRPGKFSKKAAKVLAWNDTFLNLLWTQKMPAGIYDLFIQPYRMTPIYLTTLNIMNPIIDEVIPNNGSINELITVYGWYFTTKKPKIYLGDCLTAKRKSCKVIRYYMDQNTGDSLLEFIVPKLNAGDYNLIIKTLIGETSTLFHVD